MFILKRLPPITAFIRKEFGNPLWWLLVGYGLSELDGWWLLVPILIGILLGHLWW